MGIGKEKIRSTTTPLVSFTGDKLYPMGIITLPVTAGTRPHQVTKVVNFLIVDRPSAYNAIIGRLTLNKMKAVTSTYHLLMRFSIEEGVGEVRGDQTMTRECYVTSLKGKEFREALVIEDMEDRDDDQLRRTRPTEDLKELGIDPNHPKQVVHVGRMLLEEIKLRLQELLTTYRGAFAWTHANMPEIDPRVITHRLSVDPTVKPIRQKKRTFAADRNQAIGEEVEKLQKAGFIREVAYPDWMANLVLVKKSNEKWMMCVDFTDLNKTCPKDSFPLPRIDALVDSTSGHALLSFMDAFLSYNQIRIEKGDGEKTSFITNRGTYCYEVMPFGLKNAGATY